MTGRHIGSLDVSLLLLEVPINEAVMLWRMKGQQGDKWRKASIDIGYTGGEFQVGRVLNILIVRMGEGLVYNLQWQILVNGPCHFAYRW